MTNDDPRLRGASRAILVMLGWLWAGCLTVPVVTLFGESRPLWRWLGAAGLLILTVAYAGVAYALASPSLPAGRRRLLGLAFAVAAALSIVLVAPVGPDDRYTWAWIGGAAAGVVPLLLRECRRWLVVVVTAAVVVVAVVVGAFTGGSLFVHGLIAVSVGALAVATVVLPYWLWNLLLEARAGREAQARLAVTEERLRFARDVHDLLGHRLAVIALKAEVAERLSGVDPERAAREAAEVRHLSASALSEVREAVHGYRTVDLLDQLQAVSNVLRDAGVRCTVRRPDSLALSPDVATQLALALREGCTNVLRHSRASWCTISLTVDGVGAVGGVGAGEVRMVLANDGVAASTTADRHSFGLRGTADRLASIGGTLRTSRTGDTFTLEIVVPGGSEQDGLA